jgi:hypothetical protein
MPGTTLRNLAPDDCTTTMVPNHPALTMQAVMALGASMMQASQTKLWPWRTTEL